MRKKYYPELPSSIEDIMAYSEAATFIIKPDGTIVSTNDEAVRMFGFETHQEICSQRAADLTPEDFSEFFPEEISDEHITNYRYLPRVNRRKNNKIFASEVLTYKIENDSNSYIAVYVREVEEYSELDANLKHRCLEQNMHILLCELKKERRLRAQMVREKISQDDLTLFSSFLAGRYTSLTNSNLKMCMMLIRNLSSAEIANKLSITMEGVFAARKRIRKKLGLPKNEDLVIFLQRTFGDVLNEKDKTGR